MIPKQDRHGARTPADLERKYQFEKRYKDAAKLTETVNKNADSSNQAIEQLSQQYANLSAELGLKLGVDNDGNVVSEINGIATVIKFLANSISIRSDNFELLEDGTVIAKSGKIGDWNIGVPSELAKYYEGTTLYSDTYLSDSSEEVTVYLTPEKLYVQKRSGLEVTMDYASWADIVRVVNNAS